MDNKLYTQRGRSGWLRPAVSVLAICFLMLGAALVSGSLFRLGTLKDGEIFDASVASAHSELSVKGNIANVLETETSTTTPGATGTTTTTPGSTGTTTPGSTETGTTTPGTTGTTTPGSTGTTTPGSTGTAGTPVSTGTTTPGSTGTTTPGATGTTTGTPGPGCTASGTASISIVSGGFSPSTINVDIATAVTWTNNSGSRARIRDINRVLFDSGDIQPGGSWTYTFCNNGSFQYENQRGSGTGWVIVGTGGSTTTPNPSTTTTPGSTGTTTPGSTTTGTPGSTGTRTAEPTETEIETTTPGTTTTRTTTPGTTATGTAGGTQTAGTTRTATAGSTGTAVASATGTVEATTTPGACAIGFSDVPAGSTFYKFVQCLTCRSILGGYTDGTFRPSNTVTRGQLAKIVSNAAGYTDTPASQTFSDVPASDTFYVFVERAVMHGVLGGYADGTFRPANNATRGQIAKVVSNAARLNDVVTGQTFEDVAAGSTFYEFVERLAARTIMGGYACGGVGEPCGSSSLPYFRPANDATRGQVAKIVSNTFFPNCTP